MKGGVSVFGGVQLAEVAGEGDVFGGELGSSALVRDLIPLPPHNTNQHLKEKNVKGVDFLEKPSCVDAN